MKEHYHFIGIGGSGMGPLASLMLAKGYTVSGSDLKESPVVKQLREKGAEVFIGHRAENVDGAQILVYSSAVTPENPEMKEAKRLNIPVLRRAQLLAQLMNAQTGVSVAGAHGKTTTTSMVSNLLIKADFRPTTAVGGIVNGASSNAALGDGKYFVAEMDESDGTFLYFYPRYAVVTNVDFEHVDYYHTFENVLAGYKKFMQQVSHDGYLLVWGEDPNLRRLSSDLKCKVLTYGFEENNDIYADNIKASDKGGSYDCYYQDKKIGRIELVIPGKHNILNSLAAVGIGMLMGIDFKTIQASLQEYRGVQRRFSIRGTVNDVMVVDDYGHHPTEIKATIETARLFNAKRLVTVFQPHRYTRTQFLMEEFADTLALTDYLVLTDIYAASEKPIEGVTSEKLWERIRAKGKISGAYRKKDEILKHLAQVVQSGDLVLILGAGDINQLSEQLLNYLKEQTQSRV